ncbi:siderophore-interacting protein [Leucobacter chinensis]|uniref:siderophore-interacting protein n=1 Tax=Leucobacter chinensis TaxID=2851010 RepID=UPI001C2292E3|nr:siderophore-interacting protein [Leucobacter chinensis]
MTEKATLPRFVHYRATVVRTKLLGPDFLRVTFGGEGLVDFACSGVAPKIKVFLPDETRTHAADESLEGLLEGATMRTYTVRANREHEAEVDIDFVIHPEGPAGRWAAQAEPGQALVLSNAAGKDPLTAHDVLLIGDPSAVPAVMTIVESLPSDATARVLIRVDRAEDRFELEPAADGIARWIATGADTELLTSVVADEISAQRPDYVWAAGEASTLKPLRRLLRGDAQYTKQSSHTVGYWRRHSTADVYDAQTIALASQMINDGHDLTPQDMDELSIDVDQKE